jgi:hypothetical protein
MLDKFLTALCLVLIVAAVGVRAWFLSKWP